MSVDKMRRNGQPFGSHELAKVSGYGKNTILRWSKKDAGGYDRLRGAVARPEVAELLGPNGAAPGPDSTGVSHGAL